MSQSTEPVQQVETTVKDTPSKTEKAGPVSETLWHHIPAILGLFVMVTMIMGLVLEIGAFLIFLCLLMYILLSYMKGKHVNKYIGRYKWGVYICLVTLLQLFVANLVISVSSESPTDPFVGIFDGIQRYVFVFCGFLLILLEWGNRIAGWLTWVLAPRLTAFSGRQMPTKKDYEKKPKPKKTQEQLVTSSEGKTLFRRKELEEQFGTPGDDKKTFDVTTNMVGG